MNIKHTYENRKRNYMKLALNIVTWLTSYGSIMLRYVGYERGWQSKKRFLPERRTLALEEFKHALESWR